MISMAKTHLRATAEVDMEISSRRCLAAAVVKRASRKLLVSNQ